MEKSGIKPNDQQSQSSVVSNLIHDYIFSALHDFIKCYQQFLENVFSSQHLKIKHFNKQVTSLFRLHRLFSHKQQIKFRQRFFSTCIHI